MSNPLFNIQQEWDDLFQAMIFLEEKFTSFQEEGILDANGLETILNSWHSRQKRLSVGREKG